MRCGNKPKALGRMAISRVEFSFFSFTPGALLYTRSELGIYQEGVDFLKNPVSNLIVKLEFHRDSSHSCVSPSV